MYIFFLQTETSVVIDGIHLNEKVKFRVSEVFFVHEGWFVSLSICYHYIINYNAIINVSE